MCVINRRVTSSEEHFQWYLLFFLELDSLWSLYGSSNLFHIINEVTWVQNDSVFIFGWTALANDAGFSRETFQLCFHCSALRVCSERSHFNRNFTKTQEGAVKYKKQMLRPIQALTARVWSAWAWLSHTHTYPHTNSSQAPAGPVHHVEQEETGHRDEISVCERDRVDVTRPLSEQRKPIGSWI